MSQICIEFVSTEFSPLYYQWLMNHKNIQSNKKKKKSFRDPKKLALFFSFVHAKHARVQNGSV